MRPDSERRSVGLILVRYGIGALMVLAGVVMIAVNPGGLGVDGFAMAVGGGLSVLLINFLFRLSVSSNRDRELEEDARRYFDQHGEWPEDQPREGRRWTLAPGVMTAEDEEREAERQPEPRDLDHAAASCCESARGRRWGRRAIRGVEAVSIPVGI